MNKSRFTELLTNKVQASPSDMKELEDVVANFPYCQAAHILLAKAAHDNGNMLADKKLKTAAIYTSSRKNLKKIINQKPVLIQQEYEASDVNGSPDPVHNEYFVDNIEQTLPAEISEQETKGEENASIPETINQIQQKTEDIQDIKAPGEDPVVKAEQKDSFFSDLQKNLEELRRHKFEVAHGAPKTEKPKTEPPVKKLTEDLINEFLKENQPTDKPEQATSKYSISEGFESYKETVSNPLLMQIEGRDEVKEFNEPSETELMLKYFHYLEQERKKLSKEKVDQIIEKFIKEDPSIPYLNPASLPDNQEDLTQDIDKKTKEPVSENFAKILIIQKKYFKAIDIYQQLALKNPEKSAYFAGLIEDLKKKYNL
ncbi:MAG: hypothetical protein ACK40G_15515 [Cytophagaceae bacterium]